MRRKHWFSKSWIVVFMTVLVTWTTIAQIEDPQLKQFYQSDFEPKELNSNNFERLKETYKEYLSVNGNKRNFDEEQFVYEYNYFLDRINRSGNVFYGDEISIYVNSLKDQLLKKNNLDLSIHVYVTDYVDLNAFTNDFGNIYINIATIAKLDSEEELMIIMAHEIGHVILRHSRQTEFHKHKIDKSVDVNQVEGVFQIHAFSREKEIEADSIAHQLLNGVVSGETFHSVMERLEFSENPSYAGKVDLSLLAPSNPDYSQFLTDQYNQDLKLPLPFKVENDSLSTHPSIGERIKFSDNYFKTNSTITAVYKTLRDYSEVKSLASKVLVNSYVQGGYFIEALDLILKLRSAIDSDWLTYKQSQVMTLITQHKYFQGINDLIDINIACNDDDFIRFKQFIKTLSKVDFNIICYDYQKNIDSSKFDFKDNQEEWAFQFLYDNNQSFFIIDTVANQTQFTAWNADLNDTDWLIVDSLETELKDILDSLNILSSLYGQPQNSSDLLKGFLSSNTISERELDFIKFYEAKLERQKTNILSNMDIFLHPSLAAERYHRGTFDRSSSFDPDKKSVLIQSDNLFFVSKDQRAFTLDYKKSLRLNSRLFDLSKRYNSFSADYSLSSSTSTSVFDNYLHKVALTWIFENSGSTGLKYSKVEDEIQKYLISDNIEYTVYRLSILNRNKGKGRKFNLNYYEIYFDFNSRGVVYVAKVGSKQFPDRFQIEQMVYLSELNKK
jgi:hypothetical protein